MVFTRLAGVALAAAALAAPAVASADPVLKPGARLWVNPNSSTVAAAKPLTGADRANALRLAAVPSAMWLTKGTPEQVRRDAFTLGLRSNLRGEVPLIAAYDIPGRDCSQYSAGGASNTRE
jgi:endoglucanase